MAGYAPFLSNMSFQAASLFTFRSTAAQVFTSPDTSLNYSVFIIAIMTYSGMHQEYKKGRAKSS